MVCLPKDSHSTIWPHLFDSGLPPVVQWCAVTTLLVSDVSVSFLWNVRLYPDACWCCVVAVPLSYICYSELALVFVSHMLIWCNSDYFWLSCYDFSIFSLICGKHCTLIFSLVDMVYTPTRHLINVFYTFLSCLLITKE